MLAYALLFPNTACAPHTKAPPAPVAPAVGLPGTFGEKRSPNVIVTLASDPATPTWGFGTLDAIVTDAKGKPITDAQVYFDLDMTNMRMGKNIVAAAPRGDGRYAGRVRFSMPGPWRVIVRVARPGLAPEELRYDFNVKSR
jgi:hypothetical protein